MRVVIQHQPSFPARMQEIFIGFRRFTGFYPGGIKDHRITGCEGRRHQPLRIGKTTTQKGRHGTSVAHDDLLVPELGHKRSTHGNDIGAGDPGSKLRHGAIDDLLGSQSRVAHLQERILFNESSCELIIIRCIDRAVMVDDAFLLRAFHKRLQTLLRRFAVDVCRQCLDVYFGGMKLCAEKPVYRNQNHKSFSREMIHDVATLIDGVRDIDSQYSFKVQRSRFNVERPSVSLNFEPGTLDFSLQRYPFVCCSARQTFSGVSGNSLTRAPVHHATALATAGATGMIPPSPKPLAPYGPGPLASSIRIDSNSSGTSSKVGTL